MELSLATRTVGDRIVLEVGGEIDVYTAPRLRERLIELVDGRAPPTSSSTWAGSTSSTRPGSACWSAALKRVRADDGSLRRWSATQERLLKIFRITGLDKVFAIHASVDAAIAAGPPARRA